MVFDIFDAASRPDTPRDGTKICYAVGETNIFKEIVDGERWRLGKSSAVELWLLSRILLPWAECHARLTCYTVRTHIDMPSLGLGWNRGDTAAVRLGI